MCKICLLKTSNFSKLFIEVINFFKQNKLKFLLTVHDITLLSKLEQHKYPHMHLTLKIMIPEYNHGTAATVQLQRISFVIISPIPQQQTVFIPRRTATH